MVRRTNIGIMIAHSESITHKIEGRPFIKKAKDLDKNIIINYFINRVHMASLLMVVYFMVVGSLILDFPTTNSRHL